MCYKHYVAGLHYDRNILKCLKEPQNKNTAFAADVYLNRGLERITPVWKNSGLFTCIDVENNTWISVCPAATKALSSYLQNEANTAIALLVKDKTTSWCALKLFVASSFKNGLPILIQNIDLKGLLISTLLIVRKTKKLTCEFCVGGQPTYAANLSQ